LQKPVVALVVGRCAPPQRRMGHAGAFTAQADQDVDAKIAALRDAGVEIAPSAHLVARRCGRRSSGARPRGAIGR